MDFFQAQDKARRSTGRLVLLFVFAVLSLVFMTNLLIMGVFGVLFSDATRGGFWIAFNWPVFILVGLGVVLVVSGGTLYKVRALSGGGDAVATMLGGKPVFSDDADFLNRRLINVVEEMALASGTPVPQVYVLPENGINAFAAGFSSSDAVVAVTRGALERLNREQIQGIVAHEFSHILNGDMRLNIRLVGILHGILLLGILGNQLLRGTRFSSRSKGSGGALLLGLGLVIIGYAGTLFGNFIKAAVSRQREFLADAAAVQFTRNPDGIGSALIRIGGESNGSLMHNPKSEQLSHAFFCQAVKIAFIALFATHPPLPERIKRILPGWDGIFPNSSSFVNQEHASHDPGQISGMTSGLTSRESAIPQGMPGAFAHSAGQQMLESIPEVFRKAARDPFGSRALIFSLLLSREDEVRKRQLQNLKKNADRGIHTEISRLIRSQFFLEKSQRLPALELALPALRWMSKEQTLRFLDTLDALIREDGRITLFEWSLRTIVVHYLGDFLGRKVDFRANQLLQKKGTECSMLLSALAWNSKKTETSPAEAFQKGAEIIGIPGVTILPRQQLQQRGLDEAVNALRRLKPLEKEKLFTACRAVAIADGELSPAEFELLRAVAAALSVPVPLVAAASNQA